MNQLNVLSPNEPYSTDPLEYDSIAHHFCFRSVYGSLVTQYKKGEIAGFIAEKWSNDENFKKWIFKFNNNLKFENGDIIAPNHAIKSWKRLIDRGMSEGKIETPFNDLIGIEKYSSTKNIEDLAGLKEENNTLILEFKNPQKKLLQKLSFGIFSIVHPSQYSNEGLWLNHKLLISSSFYKIDQWHKDSITLKKRKDFESNVGHPNSYATINIKWSLNIDKNEVDLYFGSDLEYYNDTIHHFSGGVKSGIVYIRAHSFSKNKSSLSNKKTRTALRNTLYQKMSLNGFNATRSFFPLSIAGVSELNSNEKLDKDLKLPSLNLSINQKNNSKYKDSFYKSIEILRREFNINFIESDLDINTFWNEAEGKSSSYSTDLALLSTAILVEDPVDDINFMVKSKRGICLPDPTKKIHSILSDTNPDIQEINKILWDDAIIWPIAHQANGLYFKKSIDLNMLNVMIPPIDFSFIGHK